MQRSDFAQWAAACVLLLGVLLLWVEAGFGGDTPTLLAVDLANVIAAFVAAATCWSRGEKEPGKPGKGWRLLGAGCLAWGLGVVYVTYFDVVVEAGVPFADRSIPFPSVADVGYLAFIPLALCGVLLIPRGIFTTTLRLRNVLGGAIAAAGLLAVAWVVVLRGMWHADLGPPLDTVILLAYPWGDFLIAATCVCAWEFVPREERESVVLLVVGLGLFALADMGFYVLVLRDLGATGISPINVLWPAGFAALALAAVRPPLAAKPESEREPTHGLTPLAAAVGVLSLSFSAMTHGLEAGTAVLATLLAGLLFARLTLSRTERVQAQRTLARHPGEP